MQNILSQVPFGAMTPIGAVSTARHSTQPGVSAGTHPGVSAATQARASLTRQSRQAEHTGHRARRRVTQEHIHPPGLDEIIRAAREDRDETRAGSRDSQDVADTESQRCGQQICQATTSQRCLQSLTLTGSTLNTCLNPTPTSKCPKDQPHFPQGRECMGESSASVRATQEAHQLQGWQRSPGHFRRAPGGRAL